MSAMLYSRKDPPENPLSALQQKARRLGLHVLKASNFAAYRNSAPGLLGDVLVYDFTGNQLAGPFDLAAADRWLDETKLARLHGRSTGGGAV